MQEAGGVSRRLDGGSHFVSNETVSLHIVRKGFPCIIVAQAASIKLTKESSVR